MNPIGLRLSVGLLSLLLCACSKELRKLDEAVFLETPELTLKLVRYYENLPFSYSGEIYVTQCSSPNSKKLPASDVNEPGWRVIDRGAALGSKSAPEVVDKVRNRYTVIGDGILYWSHVPLNISLDGCRTLITWSPVTLPAETIIPAALPEHCKHDKEAVCDRMYGSSWAFQAQGRLPRYFDVQATRQGKISFRMQSAAIKDGSILLVTSSNGGKSWDVKVDHLAGGRP
ncbi:MAG: hypothetical protein A2W18_10635 [Candidatus Muproteobacteria bacterium RBG_16_60_9]|uniref:Uncharacterized protein n=1 Tax=Candidatus Muproteobacteria bacterium RBG_16_60_9 TaxID=1817755 RepID=A0A1F6UY88_9PROT|nr:MAG: hypothetical protein A2W18_10635 [Candidatus Muproteobacteria bacterium RBG_16_60_9]